MKTKIILLTIVIFINNIIVNIMASGAAFTEIAPGSISGRILDQTSNSPMEYVTVVLFSISDSSMVSGTITDADGKFIIHGVEFGNYYVEVNFLGFEKKTIHGIIISRETSKINLPEISLSPSSTELNEVNVTSEKAKIEYQIDKRIVNVDKNISAQGGSAINALENTPSVQVDAEGNLTLRGSSDFVVLVDGKPSVVSGSNALKQLAASNIKQIEVITNPSAKYDVDGKAGIINVILKKDKLQGLSGNINLSVSTAERTSANALVNFRKNKFNYFVGVDYADNVYKSDIAINNITINPDGNEYISEKINQFNKNDNLSLKAGFDFDINEKNSFSISGSAGKQG
ncbi:MAG: carboxypeptidase regulatory-like domain-containing protein, partial [Bacteroidales bacterium]|nr:carboxypeptidase regulatory-like domain-containing protein [Bacteroidales bacterium]